MKIEGEFAALKVCAGVGESCCDRATFGDLSRQFRCKVRQPARWAASSRTSTSALTRSNCACSCVTNSVCVLGICTRVLQRGIGVQLNQ